MKDYIQIQKLLEGTACELKQNKIFSLSLKIDLQNHQEVLQWKP